MFFPVLNFHTCRYQPVTADRDEAHAYEIPNAVYEDLNEERHHRVNSTATSYEEINSTTEPRSEEHRNSYEKVVIYYAYLKLFIRITK